MAIVRDMTHAKIIDAFGGNQALADALGEKASNVSRWRKRGFPARLWHQIVALAKRRRVAGVTFAAVAADAPPVQGGKRAMVGAGVHASNHSRSRGA